MAINLSCLQLVIVASLRLKSQEARFELVPRVYTTYPILRCHQGSVAQLVRVSD